MDLIRSRYMLEEDLDAVLARAASHWAYATGSTRSAQPSATFPATSNRLFRTAIGQCDIAR